MLNKELFNKKSFIDFSYLFFTNLLKKLFGLLREIILAFFFGSSMIYANFLLIKTVADFFSQITFGNALQANLMPKFSKIFSSKKSVNLNPVFVFTKKSSVKLFFLSQIVQIPLIWFFDFEYKLLFIFISIILGLLVSLNFFNSVFLTILQAKGEFKKYSIATTINVLVSTILLYPFTLIFNLFAVVFSRLIGILTLLYKYINPLLKYNNQGYSAKISLQDFNIYILILGNFANIIIILGRFFSGIDGGNTITFYTYSVVIFNAFLTAIIMNINTLVLRFISIQKGIMLTIFSSVISLLIGLILLFVFNSYSLEIISTVFEYGRFSSIDTINTALFLRELSWSFVFIFISTSLFQPFFTLPFETLKNQSKLLIRYFLIFFVLILIYVFKADCSHTDKLILLIRYFSISYFIISIFSVFKYKRYVN